METWHYIGAVVITIAAIVGALERTLWKLILKPLMENRKETNTFRKRQELRNKAYDKTLSPEARADLYDNLNVIDD